MNNTQLIAAAKSSLNRAGLVSINPPRGFIDRCVPALVRAFKAVKSAEGNPTDESVSEVANRCRMAAVAFNLYAPGLARTDKGQGDCIRELAADLNAAAAAIDGNAPIISA